ncbi:MAG: NADH-quinone oxidoreductase subunit NuoF [Candidatus Omnitrophica bacterium]|nr:NADH-quinone oxidoreductase subunit NuoF [Candidatus Omnitrophota bacterium]MDE2232226.1 NADH-quinone oxidoreductase subunit NuoF [Candidatus Omnitrophota bacterium]
MEKIVTRHFGQENSHLLINYIKDEGYKAARKALTTMTPAAVIDEVKKSGLRGLGGAGFPTGTKWSFIPQGNPKPKYLVINADEGEPGTFKDKYIMELDPHALLEGIIITCFAIGSHKAYVYIRGEYIKPRQALQAAVDEAYRASFLGKDIMGTGFDLDVVVHPGAGAYICGEETALLSSLEGGKGFPRLKPPFPAVVGLFGCPTVINNVETIACVPPIINKGAEWFAKLGSEKNGGNRVFCVSGHVNKPGIYELPNGTPLREIIYEHAGGIPQARKLKAVIPGGISAPILTPDQIDVKMDFDSLKAIGSMAGSGGIIVMDETTDMVWAAMVAARFFAHESCGQCSPCREGSGWVYRLIKRIYHGEGRPHDLKDLPGIVNNVGGNTICAFGDAVTMSIGSYVTKFKSEFESKIKASGSINPVAKQGAGSLADANQKA